MITILTKHLRMRIFFGIFNATDCEQLRSCVFCCFFHFGALDMRWGGLLLGINVAQLAYLQVRLSNGLLSDRELSIYQEHFEDTLSQEEFSRLASRAEWHSLSCGTRVAIQGVPDEYVYFMYDGTMEMKRDGVMVAETNSGSWVGEQGFLDNSPKNCDSDNASCTRSSYATVTVTSERACMLRWRRDELMTLLARNTSLRNGVTLNMSRDVISKLGMQTSRALNEYGTSTGTPVNDGQWNTHERQWHSGNAVSLLATSASALWRGQAQPLRISPEHSKMVHMSANSMRRTMRYLEPGTEYRHKYWNNSNNDSRSGTDSSSVSRSSSEVSGSPR